jgi:hypothetical protein
MHFLLLFPVAGVSSLQSWPAGFMTMIPAGVPSSTSDDRFRRSRPTRPFNGWKQFPDEAPRPGT